MGKVCAGSIYATALRVRDMTLLQDAIARRLRGQASPGANEVIDLSGAGSMAPRWRRIRFRRNGVVDQHE